MYRILVEAVVDYAIYLLDAQGHINSWNSGAQRLKGYTTAEVVGRHYSLLFTEEDRAAGLPERALAVARETGRCESEGWRVRKDGTRFWALAVLDAIRDGSGRCVGFAKITRDMTERKLAQERLIESERVLGLLVRGVTDYAIFMLDPEGRVASWNTGAAKMKGYTTDEIIGQHFSVFYTEEDRAAGVPAQALERAITSGSFETDGWRVRKDGSLFWANVVLDAIRDDNGALVGMAKITRDITERRMAQREMEVLREKLVQAQKLEALGQLTGGIAHDFNNLLQAILGGITLAERRTGDGKALVEVLAEMRKVARRGADLTHQLLGFSRQAPLKVEVVETGARLRQAVDLFRHTLRADIEVQVRIRDDTWPLRIDISQFELALLNVAVNARDAMPSGGTLVLSAHNMVLSGEPDGLAGNFVAVGLRDTGEGIPSEVLTRVFEPFFTTKPIGKGTGLGLSQVYGFVRQAGGTVSITSEPGRGTEVLLLLPAALDEGQKQGQGAPAGEVVAGGGARILVVDDDEAVGRLVGEMLRGAGYEAAVVNRADDALTLLAEGAQFDAVLSDVVMPGSMNGIALGREIHRRWRDLPVLLATGHSGPGQTMSFEFPTIYKPFATPELTAALWSLIRLRRRRAV
jgi:PAS domain S-box-containing protein